MYTTKKTNFYYHQFQFSGVNVSKAVTIGSRFNKYIDNINGIANAISSIFVLINDI